MRKYYAGVITVLGCLIAAVTAGLIMSACAPPRVTDYDGAPELQVMPDSLRIHVENHRTRELVSPHFYLRGSGKHLLGVLDGYGGKLDKTIPVSWLDAEHCAVISAHYAGEGDLNYERLCWHPNEQVFVSLDNIFIASAAWSHR